MSSLFHSKKQKVEKARVVWRHKFVCLAYRDQERIPTVDSARTRNRQISFNRHAVTFSKYLMCTVFSKARDGYIPSPSSPPMAVMSTGNERTTQKDHNVELIDGSGVYLPAKGLAEAMTTAKGGTHLARMIMEFLWDRATLAKSSISENSKHQYKLLDHHSVVELIEGTGVYLPAKRLTVWNTTKKLPLTTFYFQWTTNVHN